MQLDRFDLLLPSVPGPAPPATGISPLDPLPDPCTRQALIKLLGRAIDLVGEAETRALAPTLIAYLAGPAA